MNQTLNLKRFSLLFTKHTTDHYKTYLVSLFVLLGMLFLSMGFLGFTEQGLQVGIQQIFFVFVFLLAGSIFTSIIFKELGNKKKAIPMLTIPASHLEKYLIAWVYTLFIFPLLFVPSFYLIAMLVNQLASLKFGTEPTQLLNLFESSKNGYMVFCFYGVVHAIALWGSIFFEKNHFIKTAFVFLLGIFLISLFNQELLRLLITQDITSASPFSGIYMVTEGVNLKVVLHGQETISFLVMLTVVMLVWLSSFYKLKEKEV